MIEENMHLTQYSGNGAESERRDFACYGKRPSASTKRSPLRLNLGCGDIQPDSWVNVDGSNRARLAARFTWIDRLLVTLRVLPSSKFNGKTVYTDLLRHFPWGDNTVEAIYMGEILEHFTQGQGEHVVRECYRVLKPGGILRIRVPDHARFWKNYVDEYECTKQKAREDWSLAHTRWTHMYFDNLCTSRLRCWQSIGHYQKWMYDEISLILLVEAIGFQCVERSTFHQSRIRQLEEVEVRDDLIVEALRP